MVVRVLRSSSKANATIVNSILIDCGISPAECIKETGIMPKALLLTHEHGDHTTHIKKWIRLVPVYATYGTFLSLGFENHKNAYVIEAGNMYDIAEHHISVFSANHESAVEPVYFIIKKGNESILFSTDNTTIKPTKDKFTEVLVECNYSEELLELSEVTEERKRANKTHCGYIGVKDILFKLDLMRCKRITLLHLSTDFGEPEKYVEEINNLFGIPTCIGGKR